MGRDWTERHIIDLIKQTGGKGTTTYLDNAAILNKYIGTAQQHGVTFVAMDENAVEKYIGLNSTLLSIRIVDVNSKSLGALTDAEAGDNLGGYDVQMYVTLNPGAAVKIDDSGYLGTIPWVYGRGEAYAPLFRYQYKAVRFYPRIYPIDPTSLRMGDHGFQFKAVSREVPITAFDITWDEDDTIISYPMVDVYNTSWAGDLATLHSPQALPFVGKCLPKTGMIIS